MTRAADSKPPAGSASFGRFLCAGAAQPAGVLAHIVAIDLAVLNERGDFEAEGAVQNPRLYGVDGGICQVSSRTPAGLPLASCYISPSDGGRQNSLAHVNGGPHLRQHHRRQLVAHSNGHLAHPRRRVRAPVLHMEVLPVSMAAPLLHRYAVCPPFATPADCGAGMDLRGNTFWEYRDRIHAHRPRRMVQPHDTSLSWLDSAAELSRTSPRQPPCLLARSRANPRSRVDPVATGGTQ